jgi:adenylate cyclase
MSVPVGQVQAELKKVLSSRVFRHTELLSRFLRYIVEQSIAGHVECLKESVLGVEVFGRGPAFDPRMDPIVRVDARRLRAKLAEYYETEGREDAVILELPKGGYSPVFTWRDSLEKVAHQPSPPVDPPSAASVAVLPFISLSADPENQFFSDGLTEEVIAALARIPGLKVVGRSTVFCYQGKAQDVRKVAGELHVRTVVEGSVRRIGTRLRINAQMLDASNCFHIWSETWERETTDIFAVQEEISGVIESMARRNFKNDSIGDALKADSVHTDAVRVEAVRVEAIRAEAIRTEAARTETVKNGTEVV